MYVDIRVYIYLHLGAFVLEPELDLKRFQTQFTAQLFPLLVIRVRTLFEESIYQPK